MRTPGLSLLLLALSGCAPSLLRSGEPPGATARGFDEKWHTSFLWGTVRGVGGYDLARACPGGWAEIRVEKDPFTLLAGAATLFVYSPSRITIVCASLPHSEQLAF